SLGGAVRSYPRGKVVMTTPVELPLYGRVHLRRTSKQALIELWDDVLARGDIRPEYGITLSAVTTEGDVMVAATSTGTIRARRVLLATGRRGRPRRLGVAGEELAHVLHNVGDPADHIGERILVVGGGDVAVEAALALAEQPKTRVALCHRGGEFERVKPANQERLAEAEAAGLQVLRNSEVHTITEKTVKIRTIEGEVAIDADCVVVLIGSDLPLELLTATGIRVQRHHGTLPVM
ncbi:MAG: NAD(P)-binding domain-containing protein, partial [Kofleriaceae bacterium]